MSVPKKILLADNQPLTVAGLLHFLAGREDFSVVDRVPSADELGMLIAKHDPHLLIADYNIAGYISWNMLAETAAAYPNLNILIISDDNDKQVIHQVLKAGVKGYLTKECSREEVLLAIQATARGEKFFCHKVLDLIMEKHLPSPQENCEPTVLTIRESEVLKLIASGYSTQKIADNLNLSPHTVHTHRKNIIRKLGIKSSSEFVIYAINLGLIQSK
jgi:DNA-binding NarL/FixJ family response regulator